VLGPISLASNQEKSRMHAEWVPTIWSSLPIQVRWTPSALSGLAASETDEGERDVNSYGIYDGSEGEQRSGYYNNKNNFKFVCINNNNNTVIGGGEEEEPEIPEPELCEELPYFSCSLFCFLVTPIIIIKIPKIIRIP